MMLSGFPLHVFQPPAIEKIAKIVSEILQSRELLRRGRNADVIIRSNHTMMEHCQRLELSLFWKKFEKMGCGARSKNANSKQYAMMVKYW